MTSPYPARSTSTSLIKSSGNEETESAKSSSDILRSRRANVIILLPTAVDGDHNWQCIRFRDYIPENYKQRFNVSGKIFEVDSRILDRHPESLLGNSEKKRQYFDRKRDEYFFDRNQDMFEAILDFYVKGDVLRRPDNISIDIFIKDIKFYSFGRDTLKQFLLEEGILRCSKEKPVPDGRVRKFLWKLLENYEGSLLSHIIICISVLVIIVSVVVFCLETLTGFKPLHHDLNKSFIPALNACESFLNNHSTDVSSRDRDFVSTTGVPLLTLYSQDIVVQESKAILNECSFNSSLNLKLRYALARCQIEFSCHKKLLHDFYSKFVIPSSLQQQSQQASAVTHQTRKLRQEKTTKSVYLHGTCTRDNVFITLYTVCAEMEKQPCTSPNRWFVLEAYMGSPAAILFLIEMCCIVWFLLQLILRFISCPGKIKFLKNPLNLNDIVAVVAYFIDLSLNILYLGKRRPRYIINLSRFIGVVRSLRILKLSQYSRELRLASFVVVRRAAILLFYLLSILMVLVVLFSTFVFVAEHETNGASFPSIPHSFWWTIITITTVGYGDVTPRTLCGKLVGILCIKAGVVFSTFWVGSIMSDYITLSCLDRDACKLDPEDLMEGEDKDEDDRKSATIKRFLENLSQGVRKCEIVLVEHFSKQHQSFHTLWNLAREELGKQRHTRASKNYRRNSVFHICMAKIKIVFQCSGYPSQRTKTV
ncbi:potassium voltage-gated channel subfamily A member 1-like isoform X1 [Clavelina lepadiformis]|uniref:potassium voltage-gated channel subfamily A member 1-like isoform X1 n=1 Tax=Clavelina lepadiformis TaxID=159417 RepID=UPI004042F74A